MIEVAIKSDSKFPVDRGRIRKVVRDLLASQGVSLDLTVSVMIVGDRKMKQLKKMYLHEEGTTDVLSFSQSEVNDANNEIQLENTNLKHLGDIVVSWPQAVSQAMERNITVDDEIDFLVQHGLLHLMGIHHD